MPVLYTIIMLLVLAVIGAAILKALPIDTSKAIVQRLEVLYRWCWRNGQELVGIPAALLAFWASGPVLRWLEPNSAIYDAGVLQGITVALCHLLIGNSIARFGVAINIGWYCKQGTVTPAQRQWLFALYLSAYCVLAAFI